MTFGKDPQAAAGVREGEILAGKYRVERVLGAGGMGVVVAAHHLQLDEKVAIKFLLPGTLESADTVARFAREARAAAKIKSEHVARVIDVGTLDNGAPYTVMEFLSGTDLAVRIRDQGPLSVELAVDFVLQASEAVAEAHSLGIVHRDLKPANLFVLRRPDGQLAIKVLDFGISKLTGNAATSSPAMTRTLGPMGSPLYMSPEQMHSASGVDVRTDIWALGVVLYEALAGAPPFRGDTLPEVCAKILATSPLPLRRVRPDVPSGLDAAVQQCLEKDRQKRFHDIAEMAAALAPFGSENARMSVRRISGVLLGRARAEAPAEPTLPAPHATHVGTLAAPPETLGGPAASPAAPAPHLVGTARPVASTMTGRTARPSHALAWSGVAVLVIAGAVAAWRGSAALTAPTAASATATHAPPEASTTPVGQSDPAVAPPSASAEPSAEGSAATPPSSGPSPSALATVRSPLTAASVLTRPRPRTDPGPRPSPSAAPMVPVSSAPSPAPSRAVVPSPAPTSNCRLVSSFDARGREHFTQVCDGN